MPASAPQVAPTAVRFFCLKLSRWHLDPLLGSYAGASSRTSLGLTAATSGLYGCSASWGSRYFAAVQFSSCAIGVGARNQGRGRSSVGHCPSPLRWWQTPIKRVQPRLAPRPMKNHHRCRWRIAAEVLMRIPGSKCSTVEASCPSNERTCRESLRVLSSVSRNAFKDPAQGAEFTHRARVSYIYTGQMSTNGHSPARVWCLSSAMVKK